MRYVGHIAHIFKKKKNTSPKLVEKSEGKR
jgi:hypothetical protein